MLPVILLNVARYLTTSLRGPAQPYTNERASAFHEPKLNSASEYLNLIIAYFKGGGSNFTSTRYEAKRMVNNTNISHEMGSQFKSQAGWTPLFNVILKFRSHSDLLQNTY